MAGPENTLKKEDKEDFAGLPDLTVLEAADLAKLLEDKWGVTAAAAAAIAADRSGDNSTIDEDQTEFTLIVTSVGEKKIALIQVIKDHLGLTSREVKQFIENLPQSIDDHASKEEALQLSSLFQRLGGKLVVASSWDDFERKSRISDQAQTSALSLSEEDDELNDDELTQAAIEALKIVYENKLTTPSEHVLQIKNILGGF